jgi:hypothetical protein
MASFTCRLRVSCGRANVRTGRSGFSQLCSRPGCRSLRPRDYAFKEKSAWAETLAVDRRDEASAGQNPEIQRGQFRAGNPAQGSRADEVGAFRRGLVLGWRIAVILQASINRSLIWRTVLRLSFRITEDLVLQQ